MSTLSGEGSKGIAAADRLIVALDCDEHEALSLARSLKGRVRWLKIGMTLFYAAGPEIVHRVREHGFEVFLDLKLHDIPHQVAGAAASVASLGVGMLTVHASGGEAMIAEALKGAQQGAEAEGVSPPAVIAVTVLTSMDDRGLASIGLQRPSSLQVPLLAEVARHAGAAGVVCSPHEAAAMRTALGEGALVVTPGVRPTWAAAGDQARIATPLAALQSGASHLVVGRPITAAPVPADAAALIIEEMEGAKTWPNC